MPAFATRQDLAGKAGRAPFRRRQIACDLGRERRVGLACAIEKEDLRAQLDRVARKADDSFDESRAIRGREAKRRRRRAPAAPTAPAV